MNLGITHLGAVDAWECDQMQHMNVRFYGARFSDAEAHAFARAGDPARSSVDDELQFRRELRCGAPVRIESTRISPDCVEHVLFDCGSDTPAASLKSRYRRSETELPGFGGGEGWSACGRTVVKAAACDAHGLSRESVISLVNQAAAHLGLDRHRARDTEGRLVTGSATVACRILRTGKADAGALVDVHSRFGPMGRSSVRLQHRVGNVTTGEGVAQVEVTIVFIDMASRRAIPLPEGLRSSQRLPPSTTQPSIER